MISTIMEWKKLRYMFQLHLSYSYLAIVVSVCRYISRLQNERERAQLSEYLGRLSLLTNLTRMCSDFDHTVMEIILKLLTILPVKNICTSVSLLFLHSFGALILKFSVIFLKRWNAFVDQGLYRSVVIIIWPGVYVQPLISLTSLKLSQTASMCNTLDSSPYITGVSQYHFTDNSPIITCYYVCSFSCIMDSK